MDKAWRMCDNCAQWRYLITVGDRTFCETCGCAPGQKYDERTYQPSYAQERDWRILRWATQHGDLANDTVPAYPLDVIAGLTSGLTGPTETEAKL